jgi:DNA (cytosine-5)-methyltransferase 1
MNALHMDLFSGIGGFTIAAGWAGFETVGFSEIDPYCCKLLAEKWPEIPNYGDIRTADFSGLRGRVTVLSAGVPCQPASLAGKRRGSKDDRWLWPATLDVVECIRPSWCIFENPPGILSMDEFAGIYLCLESIGYEVAPPLSVPANAVGAKHRRQRVFIVANAENGGLRCREAQRESGQPIERTEALADADGTGRSEQCWAEPDGAQQFKLERYAWRLTEPPLCRRADGIPDRSHRLKALGNAVVPQQAYPFFAAIAQVGASYAS